MFPTTDYPKPNPAGIQLAIFGAQAAADKADRKYAGWQDQAWAFFLAYCKKNKDSSFMGEDVRIAAETSGEVPPPQDGRAWGSIIMRASRGALIRRIGFAPVKDRKSHSNPKSVWIWVG